MLSPTRKILTAATIALLAATAHAEQARIRLATLAPKGTSYHNLLLAMGEQWSKAPEGGVALTIYAGTMGDETDIIRRMKVGQLQAAMLTSAGIAELDPEVKGLQEIPMMYRSIAEVDYVRQHLQAGIEQEMEKRGFVVLAWSTVGFAKYFSKQQALTPQDLFPMKMFVGANDSAEIQLINSIGGHPVGLDWTNTLTALQTGMLDVVPTLPVYALASQFNTATSHMLDLKWAPISGAIVVTKKSWDALPQSTRNAMKDAALKTATGVQSAAFNEDAAAVEAMKKRGLQVHAVSPQLEQQWQQFASSTIWPKMRGTMVPANTFDQVQTLVAQYRKSGGAGH